ncbi:hypothetical protein GN244_ATG02106 [Phytophthora infestans]|uniref:Uncharacterized protein n=1 Tax=Phytophthora infestans TaxID=4787 RepID=A0A833WMH0_PHYIN|nr:hypothetical protein GN244_ATG05161 [Phytophthora infestans]KAF4045652.1 hypothetical protein GN244_ATG02105 [Phytophthora infestans]KAF4045653.1 hypothetical protein GN244_ATG02106 [Phytophthora infestans]KAF4135010.1 hypothetical protein GN958_ATG15803 [Phytophthora infestans]KAF4135011.1 hypothetical protein GN958_ATG15804 [Phytophthora infestans]
MDKWLSCFAYCLVIYDNASYAVATLEVCCADDPILLHLAGTVEHAALVAALIKVHRDGRATAASELVR